MLKYTKFLSKKTNKAVFVIFLDPPLLKVIIHIVFMVLEILYRVEKVIIWFLLSRTHNGLCLYGFSKR